MHDRITGHFSDSIDAQIGAADALAPVIAQAADSMVQSLLQEGKILACGNGGCASNAQYFVATLLHRYEQERPALPALSLCADNVVMSAIASDAYYNEAFAKQIRAVGQPGDVLLGLSITGNCANIVQAIQAAHDRGIQVIALTGKDGGDMARLLQPEDIEISVPSTVSQRIQEVHVLVIHCLCDAIDGHLFASGE